MKILHVTEAWGGGVATAIESYADSIPEASHILLARLRSGDLAEEDRRESRLEIRQLEAGALRAGLTLRRLIRDLQPDFVHAHSSIAGVLVRAVAQRGTRIVYTPHCYSYERQDVGHLRRKAFRLIETICTLRPSIIAACSLREAKLARRSLSSTSQVIHVPNVAGMKTSFKGGRKISGPPLIVGMGRIVPQKDPKLFLQVAQLVNLSNPHVCWLWIGGRNGQRLPGDRAGLVSVTGWLPREAAHRELMDADIYLHTAAWEGAPLTVLEAAAAGLPLAIRDLNAYPDTLGLVTHSTPRELANHIIQMVENPDAYQQGVDTSLRLASQNSRKAQRLALLEVYNLKPTAR